eukprot:GHVU01036991.1.p1 GENE.GHVU01036991.1~~GHVU01036991.1.p1  ORF type:complete len:121 (-),score=15.04 GHVU01036991.1:193-555(-)
MDDFRNTRAMSYPQQNGFGDRRLNHHFMELVARELAQFWWDRLGPISYNQSIINEDRAMHINLEMGAPNLSRQRDGQPATQADIYRKIASLLSSLKQLYTFNAVRNIETDIQAYARRFRI